MGNLYSLYSDRTKNNPLQRSSLYSHGNSGGAAELQSSCGRICQLLMTSRHHKAKYSTYTDAKVVNAIVSGSIPGHGPFVAFLSLSALLPVNLQVNKAQ